MRPYRAFPIGKPKKSENFMYGWYYKSFTTGKSFIIEDLTNHPMRFTKVKDGFREVDPATVGQQIGQQDINKREIYEGDIAKLTENTYGETELPINCVVKWNDKGFYQLWRNGLIHWTIWKEDYYHNRGYRKGLEIIGNIFENKDLLNDNKKSP